MVVYHAWTRNLTSPCQRVKHLMNKDREMYKHKRYARDSEKYLLAGNVDADLATPAGAAGPAMLFLLDTELTCTTNVNK